MAFGFSINNANELLQAHVSEWVACGMMPSFSNISLGVSILRQWQRGRDDNLKEQV